MTDERARSRVVRHERVYYKSHKALFNEKKAAQAAAHFLHRAGGPLPVLKLMKLMYLAERLSFQKYGEPLTADYLVSMPHGPVLSLTYDFVNGSIESVDGGWETWISDRAGHMVELRDPEMLRSPEQDLLELSDGDLVVLDEVWAKFGHMSKWALRDYTHKHCPEWQDPHGSSQPILHEKLLQSLKYTPEQSAALAERLELESFIQSSFAR